MRSTLRSPVLIVLAGIFATAGGGCSESTDPVGCIDAGRLEGRVTTGSLPVEAVVIARRILDPGSEQPDFRVPVHEDGRYAMDLPGGDYVIQADPRAAHHRRYYHSAAGPTHRYLEPDTVRIDREVSPVVIDFALGALAVDAAVSRTLEGRSLNFLLHLRDEFEQQTDPYSHANGRATIHDGRALILLDGIRPGEYRVELQIDGDRFWLPGTLDPEDSPWFRVAADSVTDVVMETALEPARLEGRIVGAGPEMGWDAPWMEVFTADSTRLFNEVQRHDDDRFSLIMHLPRPVKILVHQGGIRHWIGGPDFHTATVFSPAAGEVLTGIEMVQSGIVLDMQWAKDLSFWPDIRLYDADDLQLVASVSTNPGPDRLAGIPNLWPGNFLLYFDPGYLSRGLTPWLAQWYDRTTEAAAARVVTIADWGEIVRVDVRFQKGGVMEGSLQVARPGTVDRAVVVTPVNDPVPWGRIYAQDGAVEFVVRGLPDGEYRLGVLPQDSGWNFGAPAPEGTVWWPGTTDWAVAGTIAITGGGTVTGLVVPLD